MSIDRLAEEFNKPRKEAQLDYLAAYRDFKLTTDLSNKASYAAAYASVFNQYFLERMRTNERNK